MATLLEISEDLLALKSLLDETTDENGEILPISAEAEASLQEWFGQMEQDRDAKLEGYGSFIKSLLTQAAARRAEAEQYKAMADRLFKSAKSRESRVDWLKENLRRFMEVQGLKRLETDRHTFTVCANGGKLPLYIDVQAEELPPVYQSISVSANSTLIRKDLEEGTLIGGCRLGERGTRLKIT